MDERVCAGDAREIESNSGERTTIARTFKYLLGMRCITTSTKDDKVSFTGCSKWLKIHSHRHRASLDTQEHLDGLFKLFRTTECNFSALSREKATNALH